MDGSVVVGGVIVIGGLVATAGWFVALKRGGDGYDHAGDHNASGAAAEAEEARRAG